MIKKLYKTIYKYIYNTILCIRFPFLYTRNRFTDKHYNNWKIDSKIRELNFKNIQFYYASVIDQKEYKDNISKWYEVTDSSTNKSSVTKQYTSNYILQFDENIKITLYYTKELITLTCYKNGKKYNSIEIPVSRYVSDPENLFTVQFAEEKLNITNNNRKDNYSIHIVLYDKEKNEKRNYWKNEKLVTDKSVFFKIKCLEILNSFLGLFHFIPDSSELDAMEPGWRKAFGIQMCKEIKHSILNTYISHLPEGYSKLDYIKAYIKGIRFLYSYRIMQIKEKWGRLCWYDSKSTEDIFRITQKYDDISSRTCIVCGRKATYMTRGWISPYCDEHIGDKENATKIKDNEEDGVEFIDVIDA